MRLIDTIPVVKRGEHKLIGVTDDYEARINERAWRVLEGMGPKRPGELDDAERYLFERLEARGRMDGEPGEMSLRGRNGLYGVTIESTDACNFRCRHCYLGRKKGDFLDADAYRRVVDDAYELGAVGVGFTGGEVFIQDDIFDRFGYARDRDLQVSVTTNASLIGDDEAERLASMGIHPVVVTLNGFEEQHEKLYPDGSWKPTVESIDRLVDAGNDVHVNFNRFDGNRDVLPEFEEFCRGRGVARVQVADIKPVGWGEDMEDEIPDDQELCCGKGGTEKVVVKADGTVMDCVFTQGVMGNVYEEGFGDIYRRANGPM